MVVLISCPLLTTLLPAANFGRNSSPDAGPARLKSVRPGAVPRLDIKPSSAMADVLVAITLTGLEPGRSVTVRAEMLDGAGHRWTSWAEFVADRAGAVDVRSARPKAGTYAEPHPMGLFWSAALEAGSEPFLFEKSFDKSVIVHFNALVDKKPVASADLAWVFLARGVQVSDVREEGLVGKFFRPQGNGPHPGLLVVGGSGGGLAWSEEMAAMFASHGFAAMALAYFAIDPLPKGLEQIPLEYFGKAISWMRGQPTVAKDKIGIAGISRGGELALLLGATFPSLRAVVAYSPSALVWAGLSLNFGGPPRSAWTNRGQELPFLMPFGLGDAYFQAVLSSPPAQVEAAAIPVERIHGPVLLISGQDDKVWSSSKFAERVMERLSQRRHPYPDKNLSYSGAGHYIRFPFMPTTVDRRRHPIFKMIIEFGGNPPGDAAAAADSWPKVLEFLSKNLAGKSPD
jgi:dienelactone hydrolase